MFSLKAKLRDPKENLEKMRKSGELPAVLYGAGTNNTAISVPMIDFKKIWYKAGEASTVKIDLPKGSADVLIHEVQQDPVSDEPIHVDFLAIDVNKAIRVKLPLEFTGISEAVKSGLGILVKVMHEVEVEALPKDLPHSLKVDLSKLVDIHSQVYVSDVKLPSGVSIVAKNTDVVAAIAEQKEEKEETAPVDLSAIEVEKKGKKEEEGSEGATPAGESK